MQSWGDKLTSQQIHDIRSFFQNHGCYSNVKRLAESVDIVFNSFNFVEFYPFELLATISKLQCYTWAFDFEGYEKNLYAAKELVEIFNKIRELLHVYMQEYTAWTTKMNIKKIHCNAAMTSLQNSRFFLQMYTLTCKKTDAVDGAYECISMLQMMSSNINSEHESIQILGKIKNKLHTIVSPKASRIEAYSVYTAMQQAWHSSESIGIAATLYETNTFPLDLIELVVEFCIQPAIDMSIININ